MRYSGSFKIILCVTFLLISIQTAAADTPNWNLVGTYSWDFVCNSGCAGIWSHSMTITSQAKDGTFSGTGYTNTNPSLPWTASGAVTGSTFTLKIVYIVPPTGVDSYSATFAGTISSEGKLSGHGITTFNEMGDLATTYGTATPIGNPLPITDQKTTRYATQNKVTQGLPPQATQNPGITTSPDQPGPIDAQNTNNVSLLPLLAFVMLALVIGGGVLLYITSRLKKPVTSPQNHLNVSSFPPTINSHHDIFISYSSKDKPIADAICNHLESRQIRCWVAPRDILPGMNFQESIMNAIDSSSIMVLVFSSHSNTSPHILTELNEAMSNEVIIIPFRIENILPSQAMKYLIGVPHWLDAMSPPLEQHIQELEKTIRILLKESGAINKKSQ